MQQKITLPIIPLKGVMIFPDMVMHFDVQRPKSVAALEQAMLEDQTIFLVAQREIEIEEPTEKDLYTVGTIVQIKQVLNLPGNSLRVLVEGRCRAKINSIKEKDNYLVAEITKQDESNVKKSPELTALIRATHQQFKSYCKATHSIGQETQKTVLSVKHPALLADVIASNIISGLENRQLILEELDIPKRLESLCAMMITEIDMVQLEKKVQIRIKKQIDKSQKDYYLREQIRAIQNELGDKDGLDLDELYDRLYSTQLNKEAYEKVEKELERLSRMVPGTPEVSMSRNYIECILDLPWGKTTTDRLNLNRARLVLDKNHYGLEKVKERIIEHLAVLSMKKDMKGSILCFVGPPGVGKTSIVRSIANAMGREFVQMSLGGVRDEAEIRGHRRTYLGAIPGRIIAGIKQAKTTNPVFLFDVRDKMSSSFQGDPAAAMLEVLDAEQNSEFRDHYLELPFDLSKVLFITTANTIDTIPPALLDRLEIIEVSSYTEEEKFQIAKKYLFPKQLEAHGLNKKNVKISDAILKSTIEGYTREAGVRQLERVIAKIVRKATVEMIQSNVTSITITEERQQAYLGAVKFTRDALEKENLVGVVNGLAYTTVGGEMLAVECMVMHGNGKVQLTGKLGEVMQESAKAALSWVRANASTWGIEPVFFQENDVHIHVPEGAVPKDGPSAGVTMITALTSAITNRKVNRNVAMTGEISLRGRVFPIGGVKEKLMAAYRAGIKIIVLPKENEKDLEELPGNILSSFTIYLVSDVKEVLKIALMDEPLK